MNYNNLKNDIKKLLEENFYLKDIKTPAFKNYNEVEEIIKKFGKNNGIYTIVNLHNNLVLLKKNNFTDQICIFYHHTPVICYDLVGNMRLNINGWYTKSTKTVINHFLPPKTYIDSIKGVWFLYGKNGKYKYFDGIEINSNGDVIN